LPIHPALQGGQGDTSLVFRRIWKGVDPDFYASKPSPDGRYVSEIDWYTGDLAVIELESGELRRVTDKGPWTENMDFAISSVFSPNGQELAYAWWSEYAKSYELRIIGLDGSNSRIVLPPTAANGYVYVSDWSADGSHILLHLGGEGRAVRIVMLSVETGSTHVLKTIADRSSSRSVFSPDGRFVAYDFPAEPGANSHDIHSVAVDGSREFVLVTGNGDDRLMGWAPDGSSILFYSDRELTRGIWRLPVEDGRAAGEPQLLKQDVWQLTPLGFSRSAFFYGVMTESWQVYTASVDIDAGRAATSPMPVANRSEGMSKFGTWSPDGRQLAYLWCQFGDVFCQLAIRSLGGEESQQMTFPFDDVLGLDWLPDGRGVAVFGVYRQVRGLHRFDLRNGDVYPLFVAPEAPDIAPIRSAFSPDGKTLYLPRRFEQDRDGWRIVARDLSSGSERAVASVSSDWVRFAVSADGEYLAIAERVPELKAFRVLTARASGGEAREVYVTPAMLDISAVCWTPAGRYIVLSGFTDVAETAIWRVSVESGEAHEIVGAHGGWGFSLSPDGRRFSIFSGENKGEIWVIENLPGTASGSRP
jgi:Tol biopolymer transport system component